MIKEWYPYWMWEDFKNGMFEAFDETKTGECVVLLSDPVEFWEVSKRLLTEWPIASRENLTNIRCNRRAWIGQASCCLRHGASERTTRAAWAMLSSDEQIEANIVAMRIIDVFTSENRKSHQGVGESMLFGNPRHGAGSTCTTEQSAFVPSNSDGNTDKRCLTKISRRNSRDL